MEWYYANESDQQISFPEEDFQRLVDEGAIKRETLVWNETMSDWKACGYVRPGMFDGVTPAASATPPQQASGAAAATQPAVVPGAPPVGTTSPTPPADGLAITALVCGILGFVCYPLGFVFGLVAVICGHTSRKNLVARTGSTNGGGLSLAGIILGYIGIAVGLLFGVIMIVSILAESGNF